MLLHNWRIDVFDDRDSIHPTYSEPFNGSEEAAAERACELLERFKGMKADVVPS